MLRHTLVLLTLLHLCGSETVAAQGLALGGRAGTLGVGGELALSLTERVVLRGGGGFMPFEPTVTLSDVEVKLTLPTVYNVGLDLYVNGAMRVGGGVLFRSSDPEVAAEFSAPQDIGGSTFNPQQLGTLTGVFDAKDSAVYVLIGFGRHTAPGSGLFVDFGFAFVGEPSVALNASGGSLSDQTEPLRSALDREAVDFEEDMPGYLKIFPVFSLGFRLGT
jgi:hypothetical protein